MAYSGYRGRYKSEPVHITLPGDLYADLEVRRQFEEKNRSEIIAEALRSYLAEKDAEDLDRRERIGDKFEDMQEAIKKQADRLATLEVRNRYAVEMVYELLDEISRSSQDREEMRRRAAAAIQRERSQERQRREQEAREREAQQQRGREESDGEEWIL